MQRQEIAELQRRVEPTATTTNVVPGSWAIGEMKWRTNWTSVGAASPEAALLTYWWAVANLNIEGLKTSMIFDSGEPIPDSVARHEYEYEGPRTYGRSFGGIRLKSIKQSNDSATIEIEFLDRITAKGGIPVSENEPPEWSVDHQGKTFELVKTDDGWRVIRDRNRKRIRLDDPDFEAVARELITVPPEVVEKWKPRLPLATLRAYEELKARAAK